VSSRPKNKNKNKILLLIHLAVTDKKLHKKVSVPSINLIKFIWVDELRACTEMSLMQKYLTNLASEQIEGPLLLSLLKNYMAFLLR